MLAKKIILSVTTAAILFSCKVDPRIEKPLPADDLVEKIPEGWPQPVYRFENNPISEKTFVLGRALFYETALSKDNSISCASCHQQFAAFANSDHKVSHGINNQNGTRNAPGIFNLTWHPTFMHDGGINHIEVQPLGPIGNPIEMDEDLGRIIDKLKASEQYKRMFREAFGTEEVNSQRMLWSMAQFMGLIYSVDSKFDRYKRHEEGITLTEQEQRGYELFQASCNNCHKEPLFSDFKYRNNGLAVNPVVKDSGRAHITREPQDVYLFKTPSLRNIGLTAPYMHDGRYSSLEECLDHYTDKVENTVNLDPALAGGLTLNADGKRDLVAFLHTLDDFKMINDKRFSDPNFK